MSPELIGKPEAFRAACERRRSAGGRLALVPTMGALHDGHLALVAEAQRRAEVVALSVFVNPTQFGPGEDLDRYPHDLARDLELCGAAGVDLVFAPEREAMYPPGESTRVQVHGLTRYLCGAARPGHFEGVATIVAKLFGLSGPCVAVFGRKDFQQLKVVQRLVRDLMLPIEVVGHPTYREPDGLALSSRNAYLSPEQRATAAELPRAMLEVAEAFERGERSATALMPRLRARLSEAGMTIDYAALSDPESLEPLGEGRPLPNRVSLAVAAFAGSTRLIDNFVLGEEPLAALRGRA